MGIFCNMNAKRIRHFVCCSRIFLECLSTDMHTYHGRLMHSMTVTSHVPSFSNHGTSVNKLKNTDLVCFRHLSKIINPEQDARITTKDIKKFLVEYKIKFEDGYTCLVTDCNFCQLLKKGKSTGKLYINRTTGTYLCLNCHSSGPWEDLQDLLSLIKMDNKTKMPSVKCYPPWLPTEQELEPVLVALNGAKPIKDLDSLKWEDIIEKFHIQVLNRTILEKYEARISPDSSQLLFPIYEVNGKIVGLHVLKSGENREVEIVPRNLTGVLFGWKQSNSKSDTIIISSKPLDALAVKQEVNIPVVSLLHGKLLPLEVLPLLEPYSKIILWVGNDVYSWELAKIFAHKLNERRCFLIRPQEDHPAPLEALQKKFSISNILKSAHPVAHKAITSFNALRQEVLAQLLHVEQVAGIKWKRYPLLAKYLKGHRRGELTVFTGSTGSGKTTFMSEYSLDLCIQGVRTLWGSFEIQNSRLAKMMLTQFALSPLDKHLETFDYWADQFEKLALYFLTFHGAQNIRSVLDAMRHAVYVHDIEHVVVDNLQFMLGASKDNDRFFQQDMVISSFRQFATVHKCHVTLVIHPRKENTEELNIMSIFGGAKASQEADNVLILQDNRLNSLRGRKYIQVAKNRFDGDLGIVPLTFDKETLSFALKKKPKSLELVSDGEEATKEEIPKDT